MLTVNISGKTYIFMNFYPCKAKDFKNKVVHMTATIQKHRGNTNGYQDPNKSRVL